VLSQTRRALEFLTDRHGMVVTGGFGLHECWHDDQDGGPGLAESCATAYLLRVLDEMLQLEPDPRWGDLTERVIYNTLFAAQSPDGRRIRYYTPFEGPREYWHLDTYCCPNNFRRAVGLLPDLVYYRSTDGIYVNLFAPSACTFSLEDGTEVEIRQKTNYPSSGAVQLTFATPSPTQFVLSIRIPRWCAVAEARVNGEPVHGGHHDGVLTVGRRWRQGDVVELELPMRRRLVRGRRAQSGRVAVMRGPMVYCLNPRRAKPRLDGASPHDLRYLTIDPESLGERVPDDEVRPGGGAVAVRAWSRGTAHVAKPDVELTLTEFPDPEGRGVFLRIPRPDYDFLADDELLAPAGDG
jgi:DUF1680 family protein